MDHVVYLDAKANELELMLGGTKNMIIRGATGRKIPYGRVFEGDILYFVNNNGEGLVKAKAIVNSVIFSDKLDKCRSVRLVKENMDSLVLSKQQFERCAGKIYIVLIDVQNIIKVEPFEIDKSEFGNMDDWLMVGNIEKCKLKTV